MVLFVRKKTLLTSASCNEQIKEISFLLAEFSASNTLKGLTFTNKAELLERKFPFLINLNSSCIDR